MYICIYRITKEEVLDRIQFYENEKIYWVIENILRHEGLLIKLNFRACTRVREGLKYYQFQTALSFKLIRARRSN